MIHLYLFLKLLDSVIHKSYKILITINVQNCSDFR